MSKGLLFIVCIIIINSAFSCSTERKNEESRGPSKSIISTYEDGTYTGEGDKWQYGNEDAIVIIKDKKIAGITLRKLGSDGKEVNYEDWTGKAEGNETKPNLKQFRVDLGSKMVDKQTYDVDEISGATVSSNNWKIAAKRALEKASK